MTLTQKSFDITTNDLAEYYNDLRELKQIAKGKKVKKIFGPQRLVYRNAGKEQVILSNATFALCQSEKKKRKATGNYNAGKLIICP